MESLSLEVFKELLDRALSAMIYLPHWCSVLGWALISETFSSLSVSVLLCEMFHRIHH